MAKQMALSFIGAGNMAEAIARGVLKSGVLAPNDIIAADPSEQRRQIFTRELGIRTVADSAEAAGVGRVVLLAIKPQMIQEALEQIAPVISTDTLIISIVAAITAGFIEKTLTAASEIRGARAIAAGTGPRVIRVMPNTPMLVGSGMSALARGTYATDMDLQQAERIFAAGGKTVRVNENQMNAITALSGSGPAYLFYLTEAMAAAGEKLGLSATDAAILARQTVIGSAELLAKSNDSPAELRRKVTSPGGTTQAAITAFEAGGFMDLVAKALAAAERRGGELSK